MTTLEHQIVIPLSKKKLTLIVIGSIIFVVLGILVVMNPEKYISIVMRSPTIIFIVGVASILFFGLCFVFLVKKLADNSPGLIISKEGILDNSSGVSAGQILWTDIENISVTEIHRQKLILLQIKNPQAFIDKQKSWFKRKLMVMNFKMYGTPVSITSNGLKISSDELLSKLTSKFSASQQ